MMFDTLVIGAGHAGLAMSRTLQQAGRSHLVLERDQIGSSWRTRWDSFHLNTPSQNNRLPDAHPDETDAFWSRDAWVAHLEAYAAAHDLPVRTGVTVEGVAREADGFVVSTDAGVFRARHVVLCTGDQNLASLPGLAEALPGDIDQLHTADYRRPEALAEGAVLVVGSAQSGVQITEDLLEAGRDVYLCTSPVGRAPRRYRGRDITDWMQALGLHNHGPDDVPPEERGARQGMISGTRGGHSVSLHSLAREGATLLGRLEGIRGRTLEVGDDLLDNVAVGDTGSQKLRQGLDGFIAAQGLDVPAAEPDPADIPFEDLAAHAAIRSLDLDEAGITTVIWATGFRGSFAYLPDGWLAGGVPRHSDGVCEVEGLYCLGLQWGRRRISALIMGAEGDAERLLAHMADHDTPAAEREIVELHARVEAWISGRGGDFDDIDTRFHPDFTLFAPSGAQLARSDLMAGLSGAEGANPDFGICIQDVRVVADGPDTVVATCTMWQRGARASARTENGRWITAVFARDPSAPHGLAWLHAHEGWLPEAVQDAGDYAWD